MLVPLADTNYVATWKEDKNHDNKPDEDQYVTLTFESAYGFEEGESPRTLEDQVPGLAFQAPTPVDTDTDNVVFVGWDNGLAKNGAGTVPAEDTTYTAQYKADLNNDGTPDDEQYVDVTFAIAEEDATKGTLEGETSYTDLVPGLELTVPTVADTEGDDWAFDGWTPALTEGEDGNVLVPSETTNYVAHWAEDTNHNNQPDEDESYSLTITYAYAQGEEGSAALPAVNRQNDLAVGHAYSVASPEIEGYVAVPAVVSGTISDRDVSATVLYYIDSNGNDVPDSQEPDDGGNGGGGGSSDEDDDDGGSGGTGGGTTGGGTAADTTTGTGTTPGAGTGAAPAPVTTVTIAADDADAADTADDADAAEGADEDYALEEVGEDTENAAEDEESVATINEDETPLANQQIHSPVCILHWLILLAALIIAVIFIWDGHNRKKRIEELKKELGMK